MVSKFSNSKQHDDVKIPYNADVAFFNDRNICLFVTVCSLVSTFLKYPVHLTRNIDVFPFLCFRAKSG